MSSPPLIPNPLQPQRLWSLSFLMAVVGVHFYFVAFAMSIVQIPKAMEDQAPWVIGLVVGSMGIAGMVTRPFVGMLVDGGNRQRWMRVGAVATIVAFLAYATGLGPWGMLPFRMLHGIAMGLFTTSLLAIVGSSLPPARRGLGMGLYQSANTAAALYAATMAIWLITGFSFTVAFLVSAAAAVLALAFGSLAGDPMPPAPRARPTARIHTRIFSRSAFLPAVVFLTMTTPWGVISAFLPLFADERSLGNPGLFFMAVAAAQLVAKGGGGWVSDRFGRASVITPGLVLGVAGLVVLASAQSQWMLLGAAGLYGLGIAATQTTVAALIVDRSPPADLGSSMATYTMAWDVGQVAGSIGLGVVAQLTGSYAFVFALSAVFPVAGVVLFLGRVNRAPERVADQPAAARP